LRSSACAASIRSLRSAENSRNTETPTFGELPYLSQRGHPKWVTRATWLVSPVCRASRFLAGLLSQS
jgi:hypothetical protein